MRNLQKLKSKESFFTQPWSHGSNQKPLSSGHSPAFPWLSGNASGNFEPRKPGISALLCLTTVGFSGCFNDHINNQTGMESPSEHLIVKEHMCLCHGQAFPARILFIWPWISSVYSIHLLQPPTENPCQLFPTLLESLKLDQVSVGGSYF